MQIYSTLNTLLINIPIPRGYFFGFIIRKRQFKCFFNDPTSRVIENHCQR